MRRRGWELRVWKVDKNFANPELSWSGEKFSTWREGQGWGGEDGAHRVQGDLALVEPGLALLSRQHQGAVTEPGPHHRHTVLRPADLGGLRGAPGAVQGAGLAGLEDGLLGPSQDLEVRKVPLTCKYRRLVKAKFKWNLLLLFFCNHSFNQTIDGFYSRSSYSDTGSKVRVYCYNWWP